MPFMNLHIHTVHSARDGINKISDLVKICKKNNESFSMTDHGSIGGTIEYYKEAKKAGIKPIFGIEIYINKNRDELFRVLKELKTCKDPARKKILTAQRDNYKKRHHLVLIAKNLFGFQNLIALANKGFVDGFYSKPQITYDELFSLAKLLDEDKKEDNGLIATTACLQSPLNEYILNEEYTYAEEWIQMMKDEFGDDFYIEVQVNNVEAQRLANKTLMDMALQTGVKVVVGTDAHYLREDWVDVHQDLLLLQNKQKKSDVGKSNYVMTYENAKGEIKTKKFKSLEDEWNGWEIQNISPKDVIKKNTVIEIKEVPRVFSFGDTKVPYRIESEIREEAIYNHKELLPNIESIIKNNYEIYDKIEEYDINTESKLPEIENAGKTLRSICKVAMKGKKMATRKYIDRAKHELSTIINGGYASYFLILKDLLDLAKGENVALGAGRGSSGGSLIAYLCGITRIDPIKWNLPFARFLSGSENIKKYHLSDGEGKEISLPESLNIKIIRDNKEMIIKVPEIKIGDEYIEVAEKQDEVVA